MPKKLTYEEVVFKSQIAHPDKTYGYLTEYPGSHKKWDIYCYTCNNWITQTPSNHFNGHGCDICGRKKAGESIALSKETYVCKANIVHSNFYNYEESVYNGSHNPINIWCPFHGKFTQKANDHLNGNGCQTCSIGGFNPTIPGILYYILDTFTGFYKIGITNLTVELRFKNKMKRVKIIKTYLFDIGFDARKREKELLLEHKEYRVTNESWRDGVNSNGATEFFNCDILNLNSSKNYKGK